jgi:hypothetical protein
VPSETLMHCIYKYGHSEDGDGDEVLDISLDIGGCHKRNMKSMVQHTFSNSELQLNL